MIVWMTRPDAYEVYMGGDRSVDVWITKPAYSHVDVEDDFMQKKMYRDVGWHAAHSTAQRARYLLDQDRELHYRVMHEIVMSLMPKDLPLDSNPYEWGDLPHPTAENNWRQLFSDKRWEEKCRICDKRFLLEVNLRSNDVKRIDPYVFLRSEDAADGPRALYTSSITPELASHQKRDTAGVDFIPF